MPAPEIERELDNCAWSDDYLVGVLVGQAANNRPLYRLLSGMSGEPVVSEYPTGRNTSHRGVTAGNVEQLRRQGGLSVPAGNLGDAVANDPMYGGASCQ